MNTRIPTPVKEIIKSLKKKGHEAYLVGGPVRDLLTKKIPQDWDIATSAHPEEVEKIFPRTEPLGKAFGTILVLQKSLPVQVTTFRSEATYQDQRRPSYIKFHSNLEKDLSRRDFTINAMAYDFEKKTLIDPFEGLKDLKSKKLRSVGNPMDRLQEDTLRILRAARFIAQLSLQPVKELTCASKTVVNKKPRLAQERIREELQKLLIAKDVRKGLLWMDRVQLMLWIFPELASCKGVKQGGWHQYDVFHHTLWTVQRSVPKLEVRLALLFHDIAKPTTRTRVGRKYHFYGHERKSAEMAENILRRLRFPNYMIEHVCALIRHHLFEDQSISKSDAAVRRLIRRVGENRMDDLILLRKGDIKGCGNQRKIPGSLYRLMKRLKCIRESDSALSLKDLAINGEDVMKWLNIGPSRQVGLVLRHLLEKVVEDPSLNTRRNLRKLLQH